MDTHNSKPTAIIVGSGPGGLASALLLAHSGVKVTVLEKADAVGGRTRLFKKDGYTFDRGPTFFHYPEESKRSSKPSAVMLTRNSV